MSILGKKTHRELEKEDKRRFAVALGKANRYKKLTVDADSGWHDLYEDLNYWLNECKKSKALTRIDQADDKTILQLRLLDFEIYTIKRFMELPKQFIKNVEKELKRRAQAETEKENDDEY